MFTQRPRWASRVTGSSKHNKVDCMHDRVEYMQMTADELMPLYKLRQAMHIRIHSELHIPTSIPVK
jgi:hypothetical protein